jgi:copper oxidase (laccase) domain-containing protein
METVRIRPDYSPGGRAMVDLPGGTLHVVGTAGPRDRETDEVVFLKQVHGDTVLRNPRKWQEADGMILGPGSGFPGIRTADCLPVFLGSSGFSGGFHAGWRGIVAGIAARMVMEYPERPDFVVLGNCICPECYKVGEDVRRKVIDASGTFEQGPGSSVGHPPGRIDLKRAVLGQMYSAGLRSDVPVFILDGCTMCRADLFHSFRRDGTQERNLQWLLKE